MQIEKLAVDVSHEDHRVWYLDQIVFITCNCELKTGLTENFKGLRDNFNNQFFLNEASLVHVGHQDLPVGLASAL